MADKGKAPANPPGTVRRSQRNEDTTSGPVDATGLSQQQKQLVTTSWTLVRQDMQGHGIELFISFFKAYPNYQAIFNDLKNIQPDQLKTDKALRAHALIVMYALGAIIEQGLNDPSLLEAQVQKLARNHVKRGLTEAHFQSLFSTLIQFLRRTLGREWSPPMEAAWVALTNIITNTLKSVGAAAAQAAGATK